LLTKKYQKMNVTPQLGFVEAVLKVVRDNYCNFKGRARRSEYWWYCLATFLIGCAFVVPMIVSTIAAQKAGGQEAAQGVGLAFQTILQLINLALLLPGLGVAVRRLHDIGKSGWWYLINLVPCVGWIIMIVWLCQDSQPGINEYGDSPKYPSAMGNGFGPQNQYYSN